MDFLRKEFKYEKGSEEEKIFEWVVSYRYAQDYGADPEKLSALYCEENSMFNGSENIIPEGYIKILETMAKGIDIELNKQVVEIDYSQSKV